MIGTSQASIQRIESGDTKHPRKIYSLAAALQTSVEYLLGEVDDPWPDAVKDQRLPFRGYESGSNLGTVAVREIDLTFGMGSTYLDVPITEVVHSFSRDWIRQYTRADPDKLFFAQGVGDSMFPTLLDSDILLIDTSQQNLNMSDKIWAIAYAECGMVKRLRPVPGGGVSILSDNPSVPDTVAHDGEMHIIGRVVAVVRKT